MEKSPSESEEDFSNCPHMEDGKPLFNRMAQCCIDCMSEVGTVHCPRGLENEKFGIKRPYRKEEEGNG